MSQKGIARVGDPVTGGPHCHGHDHGPRESPGVIVSGSARVIVEGRAAAREGDRGYSPQCCGQVGTIDLLPSQQRVFVEGKAVVGAGSPTLHCSQGSGVVQAGSHRVLIPGA